ncbi:Phenylalanine--tRNA ligase beta subunit [Penicillium argentinense]|uniref:phenylalanine--tRNA ligase n=1 Tax=Penicillium argentinense TaxID=1131581 RepID=A0A9W9EPV6_9EURO|nr:Phenylalanine--tRNA ligase beta subunit [Penicillium argentinense]KAJ5085807.1 Phenylalanine--tRNA ligase beta subunit [Penicillium argentinense]
MPTISVDKAALFKELGREDVVDLTSIARNYRYTTEEFDELCFEFDQDRPIVDGVQEPPQLKIEIPANRYDLLCIEGIQLMLNIFLGRKPLPEYTLSQPAQLQEIIVKEDTTKIRPYVSGAILRGVKFDQARYESFIALQDKLHQNLARQRTLVSIGTLHLRCPSPKDIKFVPLNQTQELDGEQLMTYYEKHQQLGKYLHIIRDSSVYPVIYDSNKTICSLPPIINGDHSKISMNTTNIFIEITALDRTKLEIVNRMMVTMFSQYTSEPFTIEPVKIVSEHNGETRITPDIAPRVSQAEVSYINQCCGLNLTPAEISNLLKKMSFRAKPSTTNPDLIDVEIPPTRADVLHQCDIMEDVAIAYGFNKLPRSFPSKSGTIAQPLAINKLSDIIRIEAAMAGWSEVLPLILCSHDENFGWLNRKDDGNTAVKLANPKTTEFQVVRTSLLPGLLKTIRENKKHSMPMKIFEVSDVAFKDLSLERKSRNERHFAAAWYGRNSGFEVVHGLMDRVMAMLKSAFITGEECLNNPAMNDSQYFIKELDDPTYLPGHAASIHVRMGDKEHVVGAFGILHPTVLEKYELKNPVSTLEINIEPFL